MKVETQIAEKLQRIFDFEKVTFDEPGESKEQEGVFVSLTSAKSSIKDKRHVGRIQATARVFAESEKLPIGYFSKCIAAADPDDTKDFFFHDFEENAGVFRNIVERRLSFVYLFDGQYDPNQGILNQVNLSISES